jgi:hypothetical protein
LKGGCLKKNVIERNRFAAEKDYNEDLPSIIHANIKYSHGSPE